MGFNILIELPDGCRCLHARDSLEGTSLCEFVESQICLDDFFLVHGGKLLTSNSVLIGDRSGHTSVKCVPRFNGGKGGFGSMLRTIGNQIEKTTNKDACRDLNGRRIRDVKADKQVEEWQKGEAERDRLKAEARKQRRDRMLAEPKSTFDSHTYLTELKDQAEKTEDAVRIGILAQKSRGASAAATATTSVRVSAVKRSATSSTSPSKRKCATMRALDRFTCDGLDSDSSSSSDEEVETASELVSSTSDVEVAAEAQTDSTSQTEAAPGVRAEATASAEAATSASVEVAA